jgi:hypothetical protein
MGIRKGRELGWLKKNEQELEEERGSLVFQVLVVFMACKGLAL